MKTHPAANAARVSAALLVFLGSAAVLIALVTLLARKPATRAAPQASPLLIHCAAGLKAPVEAVAREYERAYGVPIQLQFGGSQTLLAGIEVSQRGDLYLPADDSYIALAREKRVVAEAIPLARMTAALAVRKGNPKKIATLADVLREDVRLGQANPDAAAIGKLARAALEETGQWGAINRHTKVFKPTVNDVANDIKLGTVDAGFVWDAIVAQYPELETVPVPALSNAQAHVTLGVLQCSPQPTAALRFARYLAARDKGLLEWRRQGYAVEDGDAWAEAPELRLFAGAMLRPAIEETLAAFERREGVRVTRIYNGCGILVAEMQTGKHPDAYFACDRSFMRQVSDLFLEADTLSSNQLVILVPKGNPQRIQALNDLGKPGLRVGVGHEKQSALGALTRTMLLANNAYGTVMKNVMVQSPTGDLLLNQLRAGSLDAVIAYLSNAAEAKDTVEAIPLDVPGAVATQPLAIGRDSQQKQLAGRLRQMLKSAASQERFVAAGFYWGKPMDLGQK